MKFITFGTAKEGMNLPPAALRSLIEATAADTKKQKQAGKVLEAFYIPGVGKTIVISEQDSAADLAKSLFSVPAFAFMDFESYPVMDMEEAMTMLVDTMKAMEKVPAGAAR